MRLFIQIRLALKHEVRTFLSRAYFKNDLYFGGIEQPKKQTLPVETKPKKVIKTAIAAPKQNIVVDDQLTIKLEKLQDQPLEEALDIH